MLCRQFLRGAADAGHETKEIRLSEKRINPCIACYRCLQDGHACAQKDDMADIQREMLAADVIVLATPVYFYSLSAQMKMLIDRCLPRYREMKGKRFYFIVTAAEPRHDAAYEALGSMRGFLRCLSGATEEGVVYGTGTWGIGDVFKHPSYEKAYQMGKEVKEEMA